ncbi:MAG: DUF4157 domain-containing protein [Chloroflexi bacterium]|nr:DUF4157 domain-containing protein [Chloroflexota bacterium]
MSQPSLLQTKFTIGQPNDRYEQEVDRIGGRVMRMPGPRLHRQVEPEEEEKEETLQAKLTINQPNDRCEQEADQVAEQVMRMPEPEVQRQPELEYEDEEGLIQTKPISAQITPLIQRQVEPEEEEEEEELIQTKRAGKQIPQVGPSLAAQIRSLKGGGRPLPPSVRDFFEPRFSQDFSQVRIHTDARAAELARTVDARAFTVGRDIMFGAGQYEPGTSEGEKLLAHELTHVVQQASHKASNFVREAKTSIQRACTPTGMSRTDFLQQPGTNTQMFGLTRLHVSQVTPPVIRLERNHVVPTSAALPSTIPSFYAHGGQFDEGHRHYSGGRGLIGGSYPVRIWITQEGASRIAAGEQEHCNDFQEAFNISLGCYTARINHYASTGTSFHTVQAVVNRINRDLRVPQGTDWGNVFTCLAQKTELRDPPNNRWHTPVRTMEPGFPNFRRRYFLQRITRHSLPAVGRFSSSYLIRGCGEGP